MGNRSSMRESRSKATGPVISDAAAASTPEMRIARRVEFDTTEQVDGWNDFLNEHGNKYYGDGTTFALGSMAVTYVSAQEMGKMLSEKFPKSYGRENRGQTKKLVIGIAKYLNEFIKAENASVTSLLQEVDDTELCAQSTEDQLDLGGLSFFDPYTDLDTTRLAKNKLWQASANNVRGIEPYAGTYLGLDLASPENENLRAEYNRIVYGFLKGEEKLPIHHLDPTFDPHATFFRGNQPIRQIIVNSAHPPTDIILKAPEAIVNLKK